MIDLSMQGIHFFYVEDIYLEFLRRRRIRGLYRILKGLPVTAKKEKKKGRSKGK